MSPPSEEPEMQTAENRRSGREASAPGSEDAKGSEPVMRRVSRRVTEMLEQHGDGTQSRAATDEPAADHNRQQQRPQPGAAGPLSEQTRAQLRRLRAEVVRCRDTIDGILATMDALLGTSRSPRPEPPPPPGAGRADPPRESRVITEEYAGESSA